MNEHQTKFAAIPDIKSKPTIASSGPAKTGVIYTCPMHPQIRQNGPGNCPICGMTLEPVAASATTEPNYELVEMSQRFWIVLVLTLPVVILETGSHIRIVKLLSLAASFPDAAKNANAFMMADHAVDHFGQQHGSPGSSKEF